MTERIAICDKETIFVQILAEYLRKKYRSGPEILAFDRVDKLIGAAKEEKIGLCLLGEGLADSFQVQTLIERSEALIYLCTKRRKDAVFKYQSVEHVVGDLLALCVEKGISFFEEGICFTQKNNVKILAFYSPSKHRLQSTIALTMGQMLAREKKVLYLNLEPYSGFEYLLQKTYEHDLMDILFFLREEKEKFRMRMESMFERIGSLDYIPPVFCYPDMEEVDSSLWQQLLYRIVEEMDYEVILLDLTEHTRGLLSLLELCNEIYTCLPEDGLSLAREDQYEKMLWHMKKEFLLERTKKSIVPVFHDIPPTAVMSTHGEVVQYIKQLWKLKTVYETKEE